MEVQNQKGECSNEIEFYFRPDQHLLMDLSCGGSGVCGLSGDQGAQKIQQNEMKRDKKEKFTKNRNKIMRIRLKISLIN